MSDLDDAMYDFEGEDQAAAKRTRPGLPVEPRRVLGILLENRIRLLQAFLIASAIALFASLFVPRTYESSAQLVYEGTPLLERKGAASPPPYAFVESAVAPDRLREMRDRLGWDVSLDELEDQVEATFDGQAMNIVGRAGTAEEAQALAQTLLAVFLERQAHFNEKRLGRLVEENALALDRAKRRREEANAAHAAFRKKSGKPDVIQEQEQLLARAADIRSEAEGAAVEIAAELARIEELEKAERELPRQITASATRGTPVDTPLAEARSELAAARASLSEQHPRVQALKQRVASLQAQRKGAKTETGEQTVISNPARVAVSRELATARAGLAAAREREAALQVLLDAIKKETQSLGPEENEARRILGEVEVADERIEDLKNRAASLRDAALGALTGFRVLSAPMLPEEAKRSKSHVLVLAMLPILVVLIVALVFIVRRLRSLTVEAPREVAWWGNGPVLGTSVWPRDPKALESFVDELEDYGVYGAGRTLVVPATEAERDIACSFAMRLADAPWLAAAILDVGERARRDSYNATLVTPPPGAHASSAVRDPMVSPPKRLSSQGHVAQAAPSVPPIVTPPPPPDAKGPMSSRPPKKKTMIGLPAARSSHATRISTGPRTATPPSSSIPPLPPERPSSPEAFRRKRSARATVRMIVPVPSGTASTARDSETEEDAFLLTRPVPVATDQTPRRVVGRTVHVSTESTQTNPSNAVMRAAVRLLGNEDDDVTDLRRSEPPGALAAGDVTGVALAWNGPLSGPVLRRAARLAHRVLVVVSSGMSVIDLARVQTRLGRNKGIGYVLVNLSDAYVDLQDRVGPVKAFWEGIGDPSTNDPRPS